ncbi:MAG: sucrase ferredoxin [Chloroflexota bacterium]
MKLFQNKICSAIAQEKGLDPGGNAAELRRMIVIETPLPWQSNGIKNLPEGFQQLYKKFRAAPNIGQLFKELHITSFLLAAPAGADGTGKAVKRETTDRRVMIWSRNGDASPVATRTVYQLPETKIADLGWALTYKPETLSEFDRFLIEPHQNGRDFLVCTHGTRDVACAKFGVPLYKRLKEKLDEPDRVWRVSHFGGHVYAPTMIEFPVGIYWAYVGNEQLAQIVSRQGDVKTLKNHYRGWTGTPRGVVQLAERELLLQIGWSWLDRPRTGRIIEQEDVDTPSWAVVELTVEDPEEIFTVRVERDGSVQTPASSTKLFKFAYTYPQYRSAVLADGLR